MRRTLILFLSAVGLLVLGGSAISRSEAGSDLITGERVSLTRPPSWTFSGAWASDDTLLLVDVLRSQIKSYSSSGTFEGPITKEYKGQRFTKPLSIQYAPGGRFWVEDEDGRFVLLDSGYRILKVIDLKALAKGSFGELRAVYQWVALDKEFFIFGDLLKGADATSAFMRIPLDHPEQSQVIARIGLDDPARRFYFLGSPYLAAAKGNLYYVVLDQMPYVAGLPNEKKVYFTAGTAKRVTERPSLPKELGPKSTSDIYKTLEESTMPAGLYGWHDSLYSLVRTPATLGRTNWLLLKVDPKTGGTVWSRPIDSIANHLVVVPGDGYWAFVEKGPVESAGLQQVTSFLRVPSQQFER
ncbi:MAG: hypothetical protein WAM82_03570 [Thermoanaerobaculia bacterium]